jgi:SOS response associated peptidase (SRAP)
MCGRARLSSDVSEIKLVFSIPTHRPTPNFPPSWNVAPTDSLPVVRYDGKAGERSLDLLRWGLVPFWAKDLNVGFANINAKAEGIETKPRGVPASPLPRAGRWLLRMEKDRDWQTALCDRVVRPRADGAGWPMGELGAHPRANGCAASPSSPPRRTSCAPSFTIVCRPSLNLKCGRSGWVRNPPTRMN